MGNNFLPATTENTTQERIIELLGLGLPQTTVASATGVSEGYVSQVMDMEGVRERVSGLRIKNLEQSTARDNKYDTLEDDLLRKLEETIPLMYKPAEILRAVEVVNGAKRRAGVGGLGSNIDIHQGVLVNLTMPVQVVNHFTLNRNNEVVALGSQELITMPAAKLMAELRPKEQLSSTRIESHELVTRSGAGNEERILQGTSKEALERADACESEETSAQQCSDSRNSAS